jgi:hypothetical protein
MKWINQWNEWTKNERMNQKWKNEQMKWVNKWNEWTNEMNKKWNEWINEMNIIKNYPLCVNGQGVVLKLIFRQVFRCMS